MGVSGRDDGDESDGSARVMDALLPATPIQAEHSVSACDTYAVELEKGVCGLGIYFTASASGAAIVDPAKPFYRLPDDSKAPGEASNVISAGDRLLAINETDVASWAFAEVVEELRRIEQGSVALRFKRAEASHEPLVIEQHTDAIAPQKRVRWKLFERVGEVQNTAPSPHEEAMIRAAAMEELLVEMETRVRELEAEVEREKKCRFLAERKNILYRNAFRAVSDENSQLRYQVALEKQARVVSEQFQQQLELGI